VQFRVALAQLNPTVGALDANLVAALDAYRRAAEQGCDLVAFGELSLTGYPPEDLLLKPRFVADQRAALERFASATGACAAVVGFVDERGGVLFNAAALCVDGEVAGTYHKRLLPNYAVFDEVRYFEPGTGELAPFEVAGHRIGITICEDMWSADGPHVALAAGGAEIIININGSPYHLDKDVEREAMVAERARSIKAPIVYVNQVGGQDELVFDGGSFAVDANGALIARSPLFVEDLRVVDLTAGGEIHPALSGGGRRARCRTRARGGDAIALLVTALDRRRIRLGFEPWDRHPDHLDRAGLRCVHGDARNIVRGAHPRSDLGERAITVPRTDPDGAVERVRLDGADHGQQERTRSRLLHDLRRLGWRLRHHQRPAEAHRVRPVSPCECPGGT
jgi:predicted amidohydrolase